MGHELAPTMGEKEKTLEELYSDAFSLVGEYKRKASERGPPGRLNTAVF